MGQEHIKLPKKSVFMVSNRDYRLSCLNGWCQQFKANVPVKVPPQAYRQALEAGVMLVVMDEEPDDSQATSSEPTNQTQVDDPAQRSAEIDQAVLIVLTRNDPEDFKKDNTPKSVKVIAELDPSFDPRPTATEIVESHERLQSNYSLAED